MPEADKLPPLRDVIAAHGLAAKKSLGQNFLLDLNLTAKIARSGGSLEGVTVFSSNLSVGAGANSQEHHAITAVIDPNGSPSLVDPALQSIDTGLAGSPATNTTNNYFYGSAAGETLTGTTGSDILNGGIGGTDILNGLGGNDILVWNANNASASLSSYFGGTGIDILRFDNTAAGTGLSIDTHTQISAGHMTGIEIFDITGATGTQLASITTALPGGVTSANTIFLSAADVITETGGANTITILGDGNDTVHLTGGFTAGPTPLATDPAHFNVYTATVAAQTVNVLVSTAIDVAHVTHT